MKVSVITPTYNRSKTIGKLYDSLKKNIKFGIEIEWLIMDDGSNDDTAEVIKKFINENIIQIRYEKQTNQGKMAALNNIVQNATGDFIIECDSDDYFTDNAFNYIAKYCVLEDDIYAYAFLKHDQNYCNIGNLFKEDGQTTTMFDLYFKQGEDGEKALVFNSKIRKEFKHELEHGEKFVTEARMYHKMDKHYKIKGFNIPLMVCEYQRDGYTKNIIEIFKKAPFGYYEYFKEILEMPMQDVLFKKRIYAIKHYLLFCYILKRKPRVNISKDLFNRFLICILYLPGKIKYNITIAHR